MQPLAPCVLPPPGLEGRAAPGAMRRSALPARPAGASQTGAFGKALLGWSYGIIRRHRHRRQEKACSRRTGAVYTGGAVTDGAAGTRVAPPAPA